MVTLHAYVLRELLKTFALTLAALTTVFTMGGGLYNVLRYEGVSAKDLFGFIPMLVPIMVALAMPVAALFAATMVYGRLASDNELLACRAAGVNVHKLFASSFLLSVFVAGCMLLAGDLVIPNVIARLDHFVRTNLRDLAVQNLQAKGHVRYARGSGEYLLTAKRVSIPTEAALRQQGLPTSPGITYLLLESPVFLMLKANDTLERYATAAYGLCQFDANKRPLEVTLYVHEGRDFDVEGSSARIERQQIGPIQLPLRFPRRASMVDMETLIHWRNRPWEADRVAVEVRRFRLNLLAELFLEDCRERLAREGVLVLANRENEAWQIAASAVHRADRSLELADVEAVYLEGGVQRPLSYDAPHALVSIEPAVAEDLIGLREAPLADALQARLRLERSATRPVVEHNPRAQDYSEGRPKGDFVLPDGFTIPARVRNLADDLPDDRLFDPAMSLGLPAELAEQRAELLELVGRQRRKMASVIHFRLGTACSSLVTVLMAAALGVIFRGSRALAAFGLSCIPFGAVAILIVMARSLGEKEGTQHLGPLLTWGGLGLFLLIDAAIIRVGVRR